ncbi:hypothetical protein [Bosea sp. CRIB-10]|uniref:hypothetical protein n=1 Tax=Bosea sp. CRIB-10 TaxID=378404 RepID=UPI0011141597|nr:hypothetical protein [Bosea sp. CRIB-10]
MTKLSGLLVALCCSGLVGCTTSAQQPPSTTTVAPPQPQQRSYLDTGPSPARTGGPSYIRANQNSATRQTDFFGNDVLPRMP